MVRSRTEVNISAFHRLEQTQAFKWLIFSESAEMTDWRVRTVSLGRKGTWVSIEVLINQRAYKAPLASNRDYSD